MSTPLRVGLIGAGWITGTHLASLRTLGDVAVIAVADPDAERAARVAAATGATAYGSWEPLVDGEQLDAVLVCTPPLLHRDPCLAAAERGVAVYLEKPIARTAGDARAIVEGIRGSGVVCAVGYQYRALDFLDDLRAALGADAPGVLSSVGIGPTSGRPWFIRPAEGGGQILERASHHIDLQRALAGEVEWVEAAATRVDLGAPDRPTGGGIDDVVSLTLGFSSGALGTVLVAWTGPDVAPTYRLEIVAAAGSVRVDLDPDFAARGAVRGVPLDLQVAAPPVLRGLGRFLDAVRAHDPSAVACDVETAAGTLHVALACERALAEGGRVAVAR